MSRQATAVSSACSACPARPASPPPGGAAVMPAVMPVVIASATRNISCSPSLHTSSLITSAWVSTRSTAACAA